MNSFVLPVLLNVVSGGMLVYFIVGIAVIIVLFLILREIACWYWKINERIALLQEQNELLRKLVAGGNRAEKVKGGSSQALKSDGNREEETEAIPEHEAEVVNKVSDVPQELLDKMSLAQIAKAN